MMLNVQTFHNHSNSTYMLIESNYGLFVGMYVDCGPGPTLTRILFAMWWPAQCVRQGSRGEQIVRNAGNGQLITD